MKIDGEWSIECQVQWRGSIRELPILFFLWNKMATTKNTTARIHTMMAPATIPLSSMNSVISCLEVSWACAAGVSGATGAEVTSGFCPFRTATRSLNYCDQLAGAVKDSGRLVVQL